MIIMIIMIMMTGERMVSEVSAVVFRQNLGEMLNQVQYRNDSIVVSKDGKPVAALVGAELFARIRAMRDRFDELSGRVADAYQDVPLEQGMAEIEAAVKQERHRNSGTRAAASRRQSSQVDVTLRERRPAKK